MSVLTVILLVISVTRTVLSQLDVNTKVSPEGLRNKSTDDMIFSCMIEHNTFFVLKSIYYPISPQTTSIWVPQGAYLTISTILPRFTLSDISPVSIPRIRMKLSQQPVSMKFEHGDIEIDLTALGCSILYPTRLVKLNLPCAL